MVVFPAWFGRQGLLNNNKSYIFETLYTKRTFFEKAHITTLIKLKLCVCSKEKKNTRKLKVTYSHLHIIHTYKLIFCIFFSNSYQLVLNVAREATQQNVKIYIVAAKTLLLETINQIISERISIQKLFQFHFFFQYGTVLF